MLGADVRGRLFEPGYVRGGRRQPGREQARKIRLGYQFSVSHGAEETAASNTPSAGPSSGSFDQPARPADRAVFIPLGTFYEIEDHQKEADNIRKRREEEEKDGRRTAAAGDEARPRGRRSRARWRGRPDGHTTMNARTGARTATATPTGPLTRRWRATSTSTASRRSVCGCYVPLPPLRDQARSSLPIAAPAQAVIPVDQVGELLRIIEKVDVGLRGRRVPRRC